MAIDVNPDHDGQSVYLSNAEVILNVKVTELPELLARLAPIAGQPVARWHCSVSPQLVEHEVCPYGGMHAPAEYTLHVREGRYRDGVLARCPSCGNTWLIPIDQPAGDCGCDMCDAQLVLFWRDSQPILIEETHSDTGT